jgi:hypothetical protein
MIDVEALAKRAGLYGPPPSGDYPMLGATMSERIERYTALVLEEAARVCDEQETDARERLTDDGKAATANLCAAGIRALKPS